MILLSLVIAFIGAQPKPYPPDRPLRYLVCQNITNMRVLLTYWGIASNYVYTEDIFKNLQTVIILWIDD